MAVAVDLKAPESAHRSIAGVWMLIAGVVLAAFNFRTAVTSVGALLSELQSGLGMSETVAGILTTLPVVAFAGLGALAPRLIRRFGARGVITVALVGMSIGLVVRAFAGHTWLFLLFSLLALAAGAVGNVAVPTIVKEYFPGHIGRMTTAYSASLSIGTAVAAATTVPIAGLTGDWRVALAVWAVPALLAVVPWLLWRAPAGPGEARQSGARLQGVWRSKLAWAMLLAFGTQSAIAYSFMGWMTAMLRTGGMSAASAGAMLGLFTLVQIPLAFVIPALAARHRQQRGIFYALVACYPVGALGIWLGGGGALTWLWVMILSCAVSVFPLILTLFGLRARTPAGTTALSAFAQSGGYLIAGVGPFAVGWLYGLSGTWTGPFTLIFVLIAVHFAAGLYMTRDRYIEDELAQTSPR
ncbi:CynX/NimT family MFS transporter [Glycomyces buryatensis]|uniref:MFS transporter n=1 Tax=Glycomyces buryatensis TaxID=2570927 RepID=A0A4S8QFQ6_9ACTN|nr:MFS transporter [Glycomyces buryatensis]THV43210.1 MFS transporter [Glycomyces buryatensis]